MSNNRLQIKGLDELVAALRSLPASLTAEAGAVVQQAAQKTLDQVKAEYPRRTGNLQDHVTLRVEASGSAGVIATVTSKAKHATLYEFGTQLRQTKDGKSTGAERPHPTLIPAAIRNRRAMTLGLIDVVRQAGLQVSGSDVG